MLIVGMSRGFLIFFNGVLIILFKYLFLQSVCKKLAALHCAIYSMYPELAKVDADQVYLFTQGGLRSSLIRQSPVNFWLCFFEFTF